MVIERVIELAGNVCPIPTSEMTPAMSLYGDLGLSSLEIVTFVVCLEKEFDIVLREQPISSMTTLAEVAGLIESVQRTSVC